MIMSIKNNTQNADNQLFVNSKNAFLAESQSLRQLLNPAQLAELFDHPNAHWILPDVPTQAGFGAFIRQILSEKAQLENRQNPILTWELVLRKMDASFLEKQTDEWLLFLYATLYPQWSVRIVVTATSA